MSVPDYQTFMYPLLKYAADGNEHSIKDTYEFLANEFELTAEDKSEYWAQTIYNERLLFRNPIKQN